MKIISKFLVAGALVAGFAVPASAASATEIPSHTFNQDGYTYNHNYGGQPGCYAGYDGYTEGGHNSLASSQAIFPWWSCFGGSGQQGQQCQDGHGSTGGYDTPGTQGGSQYDGHNGHDGCQGCYGNSGHSSAWVFSYGNGCGSYGSGGGGGNCRPVSFYATSVNGIFFEKNGPVLVNGEKVTDDGHQYTVTYAHAGLLPTFALPGDTGRGIRHLTTVCSNSSRH